MRSERELLADMLDACRQIRSYVERGGDTWAEDALFVDAVVRNLEIIGEAAKRVPEEFRQDHSAVPWRDLARLRDVLAHRYFGIDVAVVRDVVLREIDPMMRVLEGLVSAGDSKAE